MGAVAMARTTLRAKGQLTLPDDIRKAAKLEEGDLIEAEVSDSGEVILRLTVRVAPEQRLAVEGELRHRIKAAFDRRHWPPLGAAG